MMNLDPGTVLPNGATVLMSAPSATDACTVLARFRDEYVVWATVSRHDGAAYTGHYFGPDYVKAQAYFSARTR